MDSRAFAEDKKSGGIPDVKGANAQRRFSGKKGSLFESGGWELVPLMQHFVHLAVADPKE
jgi:hypothetical protein